MIHVPLRDPPPSPRTHTLQQTARSGSHQHETPYQNNKPLLLIFASSATLVYPAGAAVIGVNHFLEKKASAGAVPWSEQMLYMPTHHREMVAEVEAGHGQGI